MRIPKQSPKASTFRPALLAILLVLGSACSSTPSAPRIGTVYQADSTFDSQARSVLIVSLDGVRPDAIAEADTPHLHSMMAAGAHTERAQSVLPSITLVNHASMISGVSPEKHGVYWNDYEPARGTISVPTIFDLAKSKGLTTALVAGKKKFLHLNRPGTIDDVVIAEGSPYEVAQNAIRVLTEKRPEVMFVHFRHADSEGHSGGWMSAGQLAQIADMDQALGHILNALKEAGLLRSTAVIATADHGGQGHAHGSAAPVEMTIPWIATGAEIPVRGELSQAVTQYDTAVTAASLLELPVPAGWDGKSVFAPQSRL